MRGATLILLAWNQWPLTRRCLDSLLASDLAHAQILVVDNGSEDDTVAQLAAYADRVRVIALPQNLGFVRGMNAGITAARPDDDVVLLNNDLVFTQHDWLERMRDAAYAAPENGIVGCRLLGPEEESRVYHVGGFIEPDELWGQQTETGRVELDVRQFTRTRRVQAIAFALAYIRRDCIERIGVLDEAFHSYFEDTDYCLRAAQHGIASVVAGAVTLRHDQHGSTRDDGGFRARLFTQSRATFAARWRNDLAETYRGNVAWHGSGRFPDAYAQLTRGLLRRLDARGLRMLYTPVEHELADTQDQRFDIARRRPLQALPEAAIVCAQGQYLGDASARVRLGYAFGEWEQVPAVWAQRANLLDRLLVPDAFQAQAFRAAGVRVPIQCVPIGVDRDYCHPDVPAPRRRDGRFVFLAVVEQMARDAPDVLVKAFRRSFAADEAVQLLVHIRPGREALAIGMALRALLASTPGAAVRLLDWGFPDYERAQLLAGVDAYASARRGAGWDPFAADAIACGRALVATAFGSQADLVRQFGYPVEVTALVADPAAPPLRWAEPDAESLAQQLRCVYNQRAALPAHARAQAAWFAAAHDLDTTADRLVAAIDASGVLRPARVSPPAQAALATRASGQLVVLGMHRSGTSSVAGLLARLGAWPGPDDAMLRGPDNPKGHYEHGELHGACLRRLEAAGGDWSNPPRAAPPPAVDAFRREVAAFLDQLEPRRPWLIKEPRLCLLLRELLPLLTRPVFVHVVRDPLEIAASLAARNGLERAHALALWERYSVDAFAASRGQPRVIVDYAQLLADPLAQAQRLHVALSGFGITGLAAPRAADMADWIDADLRRQRAQPDAAEVLNPHQAALAAAMADGSILADTHERAISAASERLLAAHAARC